jgi:Ca2+-binding EF-hand superfamily protein
MNSYDKSSLYRPQLQQSFKLGSLKTGTKELDGDSVSKTIVEFVRSKDVNNSGFLSLSELLPTPGKASTPLEALFGDQGLFQAVAGSDNRVSDKELASFLLYADKNKDGDVKESELYAAADVLAYGLDGSYEEIDTRNAFLAKKGKDLGADTLLSATNLATAKTNAITEEGKVAFNYAPKKGAGLDGAKLAANAEKMLDEFDVNGDGKLTAGELGGKKTRPSYFDEEEVDTATLTAAQKAKRAFLADAIANAATSGPEKALDASELAAALLKADGNQDGNLTNKEMMDNTKGLRKKTYTVEQDPNTGEVYLQEDLYAARLAYDSTTVNAYDYGLFDFVDPNAQQREALANNDMGEDDYPEWYPGMNGGGGYRPFQPRPQYGPYDGGGINPRDMYGPRPRPPYGGPAVDYPAPRGYDPRMMPGQRPQGPAMPTYGRDPMAYTPYNMASQRPMNDPARLDPRNNPYLQGLQGVLNFDPAQYGFNG